MTNGGSTGIYVLAGPNGGGKSSVGGEVIKASGAHFFNPDLATGAILENDPSLTLSEANSQAWYEMVRLLGSAIESDSPFVFETTLGGNTIPEMLRDGSMAGVPVRIWFIALGTADMHIDRVRQRVAAGGHDIRLYATERG